MTMIDLDSDEIALLVNALTNDEMYYDGDNLEEGLRQIRCHRRWKPETVERHEKAVYAEFVGIAEKVATAGRLLKKLGAPVPEWFDPYLDEFAKRGLIGGGRR